MLWPLFCVLGVATCSDYIHNYAGIPKCEGAQVGQACYRHGQPIEIKERSADRRKAVR